MSPTLGRRTFYELPTRHYHDLAAQGDALPPAPGYPICQLKDRQGHSALGHDGDAGARAGIPTAKNLVIQTHHEGGQRDLTREGQLRANARRPNASGVILSFDSQHGPLSYPCDAMNDWESNLRAIAYHLEHVRLAGLYGVGADGEAYRGFAALPAAPEEDARWAAARVILAHVGARDATPAAIQRFLDDPGPIIGEALRCAHPDHGGSREALEAVMAAREALKVK